LSKDKSQLFLKETFTRSLLCYLLGLRDFGCAGKNYKFILKINYMMRLDVEILQVHFFQGDTLGPWWG